MNVQPSCCLDVVVYMLNCVFWRHILLEIEFKSRVDMGSDSNRYSVEEDNRQLFQIIGQIHGKILLNIDLFTLSCG